MNAKYVEHAIQHSFAKRSDVKARLYYMPTCRRCERIAFRDRHPGDPKDRVFVTCPMCGHHGEAGPPFYIHAKNV